MKEFWNKHKVFVLGLLGAIAVGLQPFVDNVQDDVKWKVVGFAVLMAVLAYLAKEWRGQAISIVGILGNLAGVFLTVHDSGKFTWNQFLLQGIIAIIAAVSADAKSRGYEAAPAIKEAKIQGEIANPAPLTNAEVKKEAKAQQQ